MEAIGKNELKGDILVVDDTPENLQMLSSMLKEQGYHPRPVRSGRQALQAARNSPPDLILLDITMPDMDGFEVCRYLKDDRKLRDIPVIFISALAETEDKLKAFNAGGVDYVTKPFKFAEVQARVNAHLMIHFLSRQLEKYSTHLEQLVQAKIKEVSESQMATIFALAKLAESRDEDTGRHLERVQNFCRLLASRLMQRKDYAEFVTSPYIETVCRASPLHDIGKVAIPDAILLKPGKLDEGEFAIMQRHAGLGADTLVAVKARYPSNAFINVGIDIARYHHEKWDGSGYPEGRVGENIPLAARIMAVADTYDALRSKRCYKKPLPHEQTVEYIRTQTGISYDPVLTEEFLGVRDEFNRIWETMQ